jgi:hypothetical protein
MGTRHRWSGNRESVAQVFDGATAYFEMTGGLFTSATESDVEVTLRNAFTFSQLFARVTTNSTLTDASTVTIRKNNADGNQTASIPAATTGVFEDLVNTDSYVDTDTVAIELTNGATMGMGEGVEINTVATSVESTDSSHKSTLMASDNFVFVPEQLFRYASVAAEANINFDEFTVTSIIVSVFTFEELLVEVTANSIDSATLLTLMDNFVRTSLQVSVTGDTTGTFTDLSNSATVIVNHVVDSEWAAPNSGMSTDELEYTQIAYQHSNDDGKRLCFNANRGLLVNSQTRYYAMSGGVFFPSTTEGPMEVRAGFPWTALNLSAHINTNNIDGITAIVVRKTGADSDLDLSIGASSTGFFADTTNKVHFRPDDDVAIKFAAAGSVGDMDNETFGFEQMQTREAMVIT